MSLGRRLVAEGLGTGLLLAVVVGSGIMAERLAGGQVALALLANTIATGAALVALILAFGGLSANFNPVVTWCHAWRGHTPWREVPVYLLVQVVGAMLGVAVAHTMFDLPLWSVSTQVRAGASQGWSEFVATFGLMMVIWGTAQQRRAAVPYAVGAYITAAYWFTASTAFANPAVTLARAASHTFAGIRPADAPLFIVMQLAGGFVATGLCAWLFADPPAGATERAGDGNR